MGDSERKAVSYLADATTPEALHAAWKDARVDDPSSGGSGEGRHPIVGRALRGSGGGRRSRWPRSKPRSIDKAAALIEEARAAYALHAQRLNTHAGVRPADDGRGEGGRRTGRRVRERGDVLGCAARRGGPAPADRGGPGGGSGGGGAGRQRTAAAVAAWRGQAGPTLPQHMNAELTILLGKKKTALEIRDFLSGEFEPVPLADVMAVLHAREASGQIKLVPKPEPVPVRKK